MSKDTAFEPNLGETHQVINQPSPLEGHNAYLTNITLREWVNKYAGEWGEDDLSEYGCLVGSDLLRAGFDANKYKPEFSPHDRFGHRVDLVNYHPSYHQLMKAAIESGHHNRPYIEEKMGSNVVRAAHAFLHTQADPGSGCPLTMTFASIPALKHQPKLAEQWVPKILSSNYDPENKPYFDKQGLTVGMAMTEKQGGSDVRANTTIAKPLGSDTGTPTWEIIGHKWFCSAPMSDGFLVLAHTEKGLTCFLMPRWRPDGSKNPIQIQRLKSKVGNISNASSEVEFRGAFAWQVGDEGKGVKTILEMVALTRFDCMVGSASQMGLAVAQALHHTKFRKAFGKPLQQQPLMQNVLADMALEAEAALAVSMRMAKALDNNEQDLLRIGAPLGKYWICKRTPQLTYEAMECIGGVGLVDDNILARLYTEAPVNAIWEGSGNVQCLDIVRIIQKHPEAINSFKELLFSAKGHFLVFDQFVDRIFETLLTTSDLEFRLRSVVEQLAIAWQAAILILDGDHLIAKSFVSSRFISNKLAMYGCLEPGIDAMAIIERSQPKV